MSPSRFGSAVCSQHSSRRSNYKQGSSCATLPEFRNFHSEENRTKSERADITNTEPVFLCSASVPSQLGSVLRFSIHKHFELISSKIFGPSCLLWKLRKTFFFQRGCTGLQQEVLCHSWWKHAWFGQRLNPVPSSPFWGGKKSNYFASWWLLAALSI